MTTPIKTAGQTVFLTSLEMAELLWLIDNDDEAQWCKLSGAYKRINEALSMSKLDMPTEIVRYMSTEGEQSNPYIYNPKLDKALGFVSPRSLDMATLTKIEIQTEEIKEEITKCVKT